MNRSLLYIKRLGDIPEFTAGDGTRLREILHPDRDPVACRYSLAVARLAPGTGSLPHRLDRTEVYWLISGSGVMHIAGESQRVSAGDAVYTPADVEQWLENDGPEEIAFICIVDPAWAAEGETVK